MSFSQEHEEEKQSWLPSIFLLALILICLGVEAKAADLEDVSMEERNLPLAKGSLFEVNDDLDFSLSREKRYCDGQDAGFFRSLMSTDCCVIRIHALEVSNTAQIVLKRGIRGVSELSEKGDYALIDSKYPTSISCGDKAPTVATLEKAMGNRIRVHKVEAGALREAMALAQQVGEQLSGNGVDVPPAVLEQAANPQSQENQPSGNPMTDEKATARLGSMGAPAFDESPFRVDEI